MAEKEIALNRYTFIRYNAAALQGSIFLLRKYGVDNKETHDDEYWDKVYEIYTEPSFQLNENREGYFTDSKREEEIMGPDNSGLEKKKKRQRKRREKNPLRRWIYEYNRYNPQLGCSVRKAEVYAKTAKEAKRTAIRHCDDYTAYGSLSFKRLIQVSEPITLGVDVKERVRHYDSLKKSYNEYEEVYGNHTEAFNKLTDWVEA